MGSGDRGRGGESAADSNNNQSPARAPGCTLVFTSLLCSLHSTIHCTLVFTALQYSLHFSSHCTLVFTALQYSLHISIHCILVFSALQYSLHLADLYIMVTTALLVFRSIRCTIVFTAFLQALFFFCIFFTFVFTSHTGLYILVFAQVLKVPKIYFTLAISELQYSLHSIFFSLQNSLCSLFTDHSASKPSGRRHPGQWTGRLQHSLPPQ